MKIGDEMRVSVITKLEKGSKALFHPGTAKSAKRKVTLNIAALTVDSRFTTIVRTGMLI